VYALSDALEAVTNLLYLAQSSSSLAAVQELLQLADQELRRMSAIATQTLRFNKQATEPRAVRCSELIGGVLNIYESRIRNANIKVEQRVRSHEPVVCFDGEIRQVLNNLVSNAIDAMQQSGGRLLLGGRTTRDARTQRAGMLVTVADTGPGIPAADRKRIFEAFFTTKGAGGTGLGLWVSRDIVDRHKGKLRMRSSQDAGHHGTVFTLFLPHRDASARNI
jgi:signal transduction histidine kinase